MSVSEKKGGGRQNLCPIYGLTLEVSLLSYSVRVVINLPRFKFRGWVELDSMF